MERFPHGDTLEATFSNLETDQIQTVVTGMTETLIRKKVLYGYRLLGIYFIVAIDGTGTISFSHRHCPHCLTRTRNGKTLYYHPVLEAKLVTSNGFAFSLMTEFIENPGDKATKQDCELKAFYRLAERLIEWRCTVLPSPEDGRPCVLGTGVDITERKRTEEIVQRERKRLQSILDTVPAYIFFKDREGRHLLVNKALADATRIPQEKWLGKTISELLPTLSEKYQKDDEEVMRTGHPKINIIEPFETPEGIRWAQTDKVPFRDENGNVIGLVASCLDITELRRSQEALQESEKRFRELYDNAPVGYHEYDTEGRITNVNGTDLEMLGHTREEMIGQPMWKFNVEEDIVREQILAKLAGTMPPGKELERRYRRKDGTTLPVLIEDRLIRDEKGRIKGIRCTIQDITKRKQTEEALRLGEERYRRLFDEAPIGYHEIDTKGIITRVNRTELEMLGYTAEEMLGRFVWEFITEERSKEHVLANLAGVMSAGGAFERTYRRKDGVTFPALIEDRLLRDSEGRIIGIRSTIQDITERKRTEEALQQAEEQLRQSQKMESIGRLAGGIAHDFNNLLTVIKGYGQLSLIELKEGDPLRGNLEEIKGATDKASDLIRQLLAFSRRQILEFKVLDLNTALRNLEKMLRRVIGEDIELVMHLPEDLGGVKTDPGQIEQVIMNLAVNAKDAMPSGGKLTIETANVGLDEAYARRHVAVAPSRYVMLAVSDTGVGMTPEVRDAK